MRSIAGRYLAAVLGGLVSAGCDDAAEAGQAAPPAAAGGGSAAADASAPAIEVVDLDGLTAALRARKGQPLLVNFWAMWCAPCVAELPALGAVAERFAAQGGAVLAVNLELMAPGEELAAVRDRLPDFLAERELGAVSHLLYSEYDAGPLAEHFGFDPVLPVTLAIGADGAVREIHEGAASAAEFGELAERAASAR